MYKEKYKKINKKAFDFTDFRLYRLSKGFTLIEIMVAVSIFVTVMMIVIGALLALNDANKKAQALRSVVENLNFAIEDISRKFKTGKNFRCDAESSIVGTPSCNNGTNKVYVEFKPSANSQYEPHVYEFANGKLTHKYKKVQGGTTTAGSWINEGVSMVSPEVILKDVKFYIYSDSTTGQQPIIIMNLSGEFNLAQFGDNPKFRTPFSIQTTVSQRIGSF